MQFLFVPPLLFGNRRCCLPSQAQGLGRVTVHEHWHFFQPLLLTSRRDQVEGAAVVVQLLGRCLQVIAWRLRLRRLLRLQLRLRFEFTVCSHMSSRSFSSAFPV